jgi:DNA-binding PadR family transcriptional regulator
VEEGSLYPALQRMLKASLVKAEWGVSATGRRVRIYQLTREGRKHVDREVSSFERMLDGITRVLAPFKQRGFGDDGKPHDTITVKEDPKCKQWCHADHCHCPAMNCE